MVEFEGRIVEPADERVQTDESLEKLEEMLNARSEQWQTAFVASIEWPYSLIMSRTVWPLGIIGSTCS
jgi:hypothetical protein